MGKSDSDPNSETEDPEPVSTVVSEEITDGQIFYLIERIGEDIALARNNPVLFLLYPFNGEISPIDALEVYETFIHNPDIEDLDIVVHSGGGDIHEAYDIIRLCRQHTSGEVTVFVPMRAMSAATLIALGADNVVLSDIGKLGPLDPQVSHPENEFLIPIRAVLDLPEVLEKALVPTTSSISTEEKGEAIIKPIAEQVDPYYLTLHQRTTELAKQYGIKILGERGFPEEIAARCIDYLIEYPAHSFSVDIREIRGSESLDDVIDASPIHELENSKQLEWGLISLIQLYIFWNIRKSRNDNHPSNPQIKLIYPPDPEQTTFNDINEDLDPDEIEEILEEADFEDMPEELEEVIEELEDEVGDSEGVEDDMT